MKIKFDKSYGLIVGLFLLAGGISLRLYLKDYQQQDNVTIHQFPKEIGDWTAKEIAITEDEYDILETRNVFVRQYTHQKDQREVFLLLVYSQNNRKVSHPPEICYTGSGATILSNVPAFLEIGSKNLQIRANKILLERGNIEQLMFYWFKIGDTFTSNYWRQQLLIVLKTLLGRPASSALIRLSITINEGKVNEAQDTIEEFANQITPHVFEYLP